MTTLLPDLVYCDARFQSDLALELDHATGTIARVFPAGEAPADAVRLRDRALFPGFVNAHSHAFQRLIRGRGQWRSIEQPTADFWSWREAMYAAALSLSPDDVEAVSHFCFIEMLRAGITTVGEFHYLHNDPSGAPYADPAELALRVLAAARDAGIRIALLNVCYATGGVREPLRSEQRRFATPDRDVFLQATESLRVRTASDPLVCVGVAPHSVRAVPREWLAQLHAWAQAHAAPFHMHVAEQPAEVEACLAAYGLRPLELLESEGVLDAGLTAVHATHLTSREVALLGDARATVCACPTTERDLGDGFLDTAEVIAAGGRVTIGSDSQTVIDPLEEIRLLEYNERLRRLRRIVLAVPEGDGRLGVAPLLLECGTAAGAGALRIDAGRIAAGALADLVAFDLTHRTLAGATPETLPTHLALSASADSVSDVWVGGVRRVEDGVHALEEKARADFREVVRRF